LIVKAPVARWICVGGIIESKILGLNPNGDSYGSANVACTDNTYYGGFDSKLSSLDKTVEVNIRAAF